MLGAVKGDSEPVGKHFWEPDNPEILAPLAWSVSSLPFRVSSPWSSACSARRRPGARPYPCQTRALPTPHSQNTAARAKNTVVSAPPSGRRGDNSSIPNGGGARVGVSGR